MDVLCTGSDSRDQRGERDPGNEVEIYPVVDDCFQHITTLFWRYKKESKLCNPLLSPVWTRELVHDDLIWSSMVRVPPRSKEYFVASYGPLFHTSHNDEKEICVLISVLQITTVSMLWFHVRRNNTSSFAYGVQWLVISYRSATVLFGIAVKKTAKSNKQLTRRK